MCVFLTGDLLVALQGRDQQVRGPGGRAGTGALVTGGGAGGGDVEPDLRNLLQHPLAGDPADQRGG